MSIKSSRGPGREFVQDNETTGPTTYEVEAEVPKECIGKGLRGNAWVVMHRNLPLDEAHAIRQRFERDSHLPIRVVRVETTRTVEEGGGE